MRVSARVITRVLRIRELVGNIDGLVRRASRASTSLSRIAGTSVSIEFRTADSYLVGDETRTSLSTGVFRKLECERDGAMARSERTRDPPARLESHRIRIPLEEYSLSLSAIRGWRSETKKTEKFFFSFSLRGNSFTRISDIEILSKIFCRAYDAIFSLTSLADSRFF